MAGILQQKSMIINQASNEMDIVMAAPEASTVEGVENTKCLDLPSAKMMTEFNRITHSTCS